MTEYKQEQQEAKRVIAKAAAQQPEVSVGKLAESKAAIRRETIDAGRMTTRDVMAMQRTMGNQAVAQLLGRSANANTPTQKGPDIQRQESASIPDELMQRHGHSSGESSANRDVSLGGQPRGEVVQRADEVISLEDYGDLSIPIEQKKPNKWNLLKKFGSQPVHPAEQFEPSQRNAKPTNRMKPAEDKATTAERLKGKVTSTKALAQQSDDIGVLYAHAQMLQAFYNHTLGQVAQETNGTYKAGPIKELGRTMDKVTTDYTDKKTGVQRPELVKDLLRSSIVFDTAQDLVRAVQIIKTLEHREPSIIIRNLKNKFTGTGYGDINMSMELGDGYIAELQLHLSKFWDIKMSKGDHHLYEQISQLERAKQARPLKPKEENKLSKLKASQNRTYDNALSTEADPKKALAELSSIKL